MHTQATALRRVVCPIYGSLGSRRCSVAQPFIRCFEVISHLFSLEVCRVEEQLCDISVALGGGVGGRVVVGGRGPGVGGVVLFIVLEK